MRDNVVALTVDCLPDHVRKQFNEPDKVLTGTQKALQEWLQLELGDPSIRVIKQTLRDELYDIWMKCDDGRLYRYTNVSLPASRFNMNLVECMKFSRFDRRGFLRAVDEQNAKAEQIRRDKERAELHDAVQRTASLVNSPRLAGKNINYPGMDNKSKTHVTGVD